MTTHSEYLKLDKWLCAISLQSSVEEAASYSLRDRFTSLQQFLPFADNSGAASLKTASVEGIHQLRIATRRASVVLDLYAEFLPPKPSNLLRHWLKKVRRASGAVRDLDVLAKRYCKIELDDAKKLVKALGRKRSRMQLRFRKLYLQLRRGDHLLKQTEKLIAKIGSPVDSNELVETWMKRRWSHLVEMFYQLEEVDMQDLDALHRLRICGKQLRYGLEVLAPAFDLKQREQAYESIEGLQDRLGRLQDHVVAHRLFCDWKSKQNRISKKCNLRRLIEYEIEMLERARGDFAAWWASPVKAEMHQAFDQLDS